MKIDAEGIRLVVTDYAPGERMDAHWHDVTTLGMVLRGAVEEGVGGRDHQATSGAFVVKPAGTVHANRFGPAGARMASIGLRPGFRPWEHGRVPRRYGTIASRTTQVSSVQYDPARAR